MCVLERVIEFTAGAVRFNMYTQCRSPPASRVRTQSAWWQILNFPIIDCNVVMHTVGLEKSKSTVLNIPTGKIKDKKTRVLAHPDWHDAYAMRKKADSRVHTMGSTQSAASIREKIDEMSFDQHATHEI